MLASLVITLREGIEAALIVGIVLMYLRQVGRTGLNRYVYAGVGAAGLASVGLAVLFESVGFDAENPYFEGILLAVAGLFVISMVVWMQRTAKGLRAKMEDRLQVMTATRTGKALGWGLLAFTFVMVLREGIETVLFLKAATWGVEASAAVLAGALIGLGLAVSFAVLFVRGGVRINLPRFFRYTSLALLLLGAMLLIDSLHEFGELGVLPVGNGFFEELGEAIGGTVGQILLGVVVAVPVLLLLWDASGGLRRRLGRPAESS
jgi:high-affinity iron transporter